VSGVAIVARHTPNCLLSCTGRRAKEQTSNSNTHMQAEILHLSPRAFCTSGKYFFLGDRPKGTGVQTLDMKFVGSCPTGVANPGVKLRT